MANNYPTNPTPNRHGKRHRYTVAVWYASTARLEIKRRQRGYDTESEALEAAQNATRRFSSSRKFRFIDCQVKDSASGTLIWRAADSARWAAMNAAKERKRERIERAARDRARI